MGKWGQAPTHPVSLHQLFFYAYFVMDTTPEEGGCKEQAGSARLLRDGHDTRRGWLQAGSARLLRDGHDARAVVCSDAVAQSSGFAPVVSFINPKTPLRLHNLIPTHTTPEESGCKQAALAYFVTDVTLPLPRALPLDFGLVEYAGSATDAAAKRYDVARKRAKRALRESEGRASKKRQREAREPAAEVEVPAAPTED